MGTAPWSHRLYVGRHKAKGEPEGPFKSRGQARPSLLPDSKGSSVHANNPEILISCQSGDQAHMAGSMIAEVWGR